MWGREGWNNAAFRGLDEPRCRAHRPGQVLRGQQIPRQKVGRNTQQHANTPNNTSTHNTITVTACTNHASSDTTDTAGWIVTKRTSIGGDPSCVRRFRLTKPFIRLSMSSSYSKSISSDTRNFHQNVCSRKYDDVRKLVSNAHEAYRSHTDASKSDNDVGFGSKRSQASLDTPTSRYNHTQSDRHARGSHSNKRASSSQSSIFTLLQKTVFVWLNRTSVLYRNSPLFSRREHFTTVSHTKHTHFYNPPSTPSLFSRFGRGQIEPRTHS